MADRREVDPSQEQGIEKSKALFLPKHDFKERDEKGYTVEEEFRKTRKNRSWFPVVVLLLLTGVLGLGSFLLSRVITARNRRLQTDIRTFENVNLREVFQEVNQLQSSLDAAVAARDERTIEFGEIVADVTQYYDSEIELVKKRELPEEELDEELADLISARDAEIDSIRADYELELENYEELILELRRQVNEYDAQQRAVARQQEAVLSSERVLRQLEVERVSREYETRLQEQKTRYEEILDRKDAFIEELVEEYQRRIQQQQSELFERYNPFFEEPRVRSLLLAVEEDDAYRTPAAAVYPLSPASAASYGTATALLQETVFLLERLRTVPYEGDVPRMISKLLSNTSDMFYRYEDILYDLSGALSASELQVQRYQYALDAYSLRNREDGYIIDSRNPEHIILYIRPNIFVSEGQILYVFRQAALISVISVTEKLNDVEYAASAQESLEGIVTFDRILVDRRAEESISYGGDLEDDTSEDN